MFAFILIIFSIFSDSSALSMYVVEPDIQCTVVKVLSTRDVFGLKSFPRKFETIVNNALISELKIRGEVILGTSPVTILKRNELEIIAILFKGMALELKLKGPPMSRNGTLKVGKEIVGLVTCH